MGGNADRLPVDSGARSLTKLLSAYRIANFDPDPCGHEAEARLFDQAGVGRDLTSSKSLGTVWFEATQEQAVIVIGRVPDARHRLRRFPWPTRRAKEADSPLLYPQ
jgi:hypothetical protein